MAISRFGSAVRRLREGLPPETVGLTGGGKRRTPGLRREELALLAGISVDYITRLEQGRSTRPSGQVVEALGRALRVSGAEREQLFNLAGLAAPGEGSVPMYVPQSIHRMMDRLTATPVAVSDAAWTLLLANRMYVALMGEQHGNERNAVWRNFLGPEGRVRHTPQARRQLEFSQVAELRKTVDQYPHDRRLQTLVAELRTNSDRFAHLWNSSTLGHHSVSRKTIDHPDAGVLTLDCDVLSVAGSNLRILVYTAEPDGDDAARLALLNAGGHDNTPEDDAS